MGLGIEKLFGVNEKHSVSLELGYRYGKNDYKYSHTEIGEDAYPKESTFRLPPFSAKLGYTVYFGK